MTPPRIGDADTSPGPVAAAVAAHAKAVAPKGGGMSQPAGVAGVAVASSGLVQRPADTSGAGAASAGLAASATSTAGGGEAVVLYTGHGGLDDRCLNIQALE